MSINISVLAYGDGISFYGLSGVSQYISCNHVQDGLYGISLAGEIFPIGPVPVTDTSGTDVQHHTGLKKPGYLTTNLHRFSDTNFKTCIRIKDMVRNQTYYLDYADYQAKIPLCNFVPEPSSCSVVTNLSSGTPATTSATITWTAQPGAVGVEYVNNTSSSAPTGDGTFQDNGTATVTITGLTAATTYHFWVRTICGAGVSSSWTSLVYTTHA